MLAWKDTYGFSSRHHWADHITSDPFSQHGAVICLLCPRLVSATGAHGSAVVIAGPMMQLTTALDLPLSDRGVHHLPFLELTTFCQSDVGLVG